MQCYLSDINTIIVYKYIVIEVTWITIIDPVLKRIDKNTKQIVDAL